RLCRWRLSVLSPYLACRTAHVRRHALEGRQVDELDRVQCPGDLDGDRIRVEAVGTAFAVDADGRNDGNDVTVEQRLQQTALDALHTAGVLLVDARENPGRMGNDGVRAGAVEVRRRESFENLMRNARRGVERQLERGRVGDTDAVEVGRRLSALLG